MAHGDGFSILPDFENIKPPCEFLVETAEYRHSKAFEINFRPNIEETVTFCPQPDNVYDPEAIQIFVRSHQIGYVNRAQTKGFHQWFEEGRKVTATVDRVNGVVTRPKVYFFLQVR